MKKILIALILTLVCVPYAVSADITTAGNSGAFSHFVWGAEAGGSIDMTTNDMSTLNLDAFFGYTNKWLNVAGVGAGIHMMVSNSCRSFPVYALLRTSFSSKPKLCFLDLRGGCVINNVDYDTTRTRLYLSPGVGFNLARGRSFTSYVTLSYEYNGLDAYVKDDTRHDIHGLSMALVRIGISF
ncbi:MAG: hypothetical protein NC043_09515 [Muribaculaceae bacterium]|nr:hypothetical protein [Muribaculaceae bacterium]